jgi:hypothetical protein
MPPVKCEGGVDEPSSQADSFYTATSQSNDTTNSQTVSSFLLSRSITRYNVHLATLRNQLTRRLSAIGELIQTIQGTHCCPSKPNSNSLDRRKKQNKVPTVLGGHKKFTLPEIVESEHEEKVQQRYARIAELKRRGCEWRVGRGRFDGSKYEQLCQEALRELRL